MCAVIDPPVRKIALPADVCDLIEEMLTRDRVGTVALHFANGRIGAVEQKRQLTKRKLTPESTRT